MKMKSLGKSGVILLVLAVSLVVVPALNSAERAPRISLRLLIRQPGQVLMLLFPWVGMGLDVDVTAATGTKPMMPSVGRVRPTNDSSTTKPASGD